MNERLNVDAVAGASQGRMSCQQAAETRSAVERVAAFATGARPVWLTPEIRQLFQGNMLDSPGCAIAALPDPDRYRHQLSGDRASGPAAAVNLWCIRPDPS